MIEIVESLSDGGASPYRKWFDALDAQTAAIVAIAIERPADGNTARVKALGAGVSEIRIDRGPGCRVYFGWDGRTLVVLLGGGTKRRQQQDIAAAHALWRAGKARKAAERKGQSMPLTRSFKDTVRDRAARDPAFRAALFAEAIRALLAGDLPTAKAALRTCINATIGFDDLAEATGTSPKSLMRMFGPNGNPTAANLAGVIGALQKETGVRLEVRAVDSAA